MDFLENLYNIENFGIYLFVVIGILIVIFLVILFFGKKDEKKRKEMEEKPVEQKVEEVSNNIEAKDTFKEVSTEAPLEIPSFDPVTEEPIVRDEFPTNNVVLNDSFVTETKEEESHKEEDLPAPKEAKEFDFDALAEAISKELESIDVQKEEQQEEKIEPVLPKEEEKEMHYQIFEPVEETSEKVVEEPVVEKVVLEPKQETVKPRPVMPTVFSSVYVNREAEKAKEESEKVEEPKEEIVTPVVPKIELPKMMDLPKKNDNM